MEVDGRWGEEESNHSCVLVVHLVSARGQILSSAPFSIITTELSAVKYKQDSEKNSSSYLVLAQNFCYMINILLYGQKYVDT